MTPDIAVCTKCLKSRPISEFPENRGNGVDGRDRWCKDCHRASTRAWRAANPELAKANLAKWRTEHPDTAKASAARSRVARIERLKADGYESVSAKACAKCDLMKPIDDFYRDAYRKDGHGTRCKACIDKKSSAYQQSHKEVIREINRRSRVRNPGAKALADARRRFKFTALSPEEQEAVNQFYKQVRESPRAWCYWCDKPVPKSRRQVDHIIAITKGGSGRVENLCCSCDKCNVRKHAKRLDRFTPQMLLPIAYASDAA